MRGIHVELTREGRHWRIKLDVEGNVEPTTAFGCSESMFPLVAGLLATEAEVNAISAGTQRNMRDAPTYVAVRMPSGRMLTFRLALDEKLVT